VLKRCFDIVFALVGILILIPLYIIIGILILIDSRGGILYKQSRVGKDNQDFFILKFRTMKVDSDKKGLLTVGTKDSRITRVGFFLRKYKLDELPQLFNVLLGDMSFVGPRPEVRKYVAMYNEEQKKVLNVKPGITDYASIEYSNENELLAKSANPEQTYIEDVMPHKLLLNLKYIKEKNFVTDIKIIFRTIGKILK
jgi:lipopolysaccharide/colanic/teichoic acid biosynthesis glycosyltransferase